LWILFGARAQGGGPLFNKKGKINVHGAYTYIVAAYLPTRLPQQAFNEGVKNRGMKNKWDYTCGGGVPLLTPE